MRNARCVATGDAPFLINSSTIKVRCSPDYAMVYTENGTHTAVRRRAPHPKLSPSQIGEFFLPHPVQQKSYFQWWITGGMAVEDSWDCVGREDHRNRAHSQSRNNRCVGYNSKSRPLITTPRLWKVSFACSTPSLSSYHPPSMSPRSDPTDDSICLHIYRKWIRYIVINFPTICALRKVCIQFVFHMYVAHQILDCVFSSSL